MCLQVLELWQAPAAEAAAGQAAGETHFVRTLYNRKVVGVHGAEAGAPMTLAEFRRRVMVPYAIEQASYEAACSSVPDASDVASVDASSY